MRFVAFLRAVNVGGTGKMPMTDLVAMCNDLGFENPRTYIASGNVIFDTQMDQAAAQLVLAEKIAAYAGKPVGVFVLSGDELAEVLEQNPFADQAGNTCTAIFLGRSSTKLDVENISNQADEILERGTKVIYCHYPSGMGRSKLRIKAADFGTARNMNTIAKLVKMMGETV